MLNANTKNIDGKDLVIIYAKDTSGCSHVRLRYNMEYINGINNGINPIILNIPHYTFDPALLSAAKSIVFQRPENSYDLQIIKRYKELQPKYGYKITGEYDDLIFYTGECKQEDDGVPPYNPSHDGMQKMMPDIMKSMKEIIPLIDVISVTTAYLKKMFEKVFGAGNVVIIKNVVPRYLWNFPRKDPIKEDLKKPRVIYSGSPTHYKQPIPKLKPGQHPNFPNGHPGQPGDRGDWNTGLCDWVIKNVKEDKIDFYVMGALPFFWEEIKHKIQFIPWADSHTFPRKFMEVHADFSIASIVDNPFNKAKSSLRFTEACACGCVFMGNVFTSNDDSPYREINNQCKFTEKSTVEEIDNIFWPLTKKDKYNEILEWQYNFANNNALWLESEQHMNEMLAYFDTKGQNII